MLFLKRREKVSEKGLEAERIFVAKNKRLLKGETPTFENLYV